MAAALPSKRLAPFFPPWLRAFVRTREVGLALAAVGIGAVSGFLVAVMGDSAQEIHEIFFGVQPGLRLSVSFDLTPWRVLVVPALGGAVLTGRRRFRWAPDSAADFSLRRCCLAASPASFTPKS